MARLEELTRGAAVKGILADRLVTVVDVRWYGSAVVELTYKDATGRPGTQLLFRDDESRLEIVTRGRPWSFDGDGALFRLVSEAHRIRLAYLFDPYLAVHTSLVEPLPHQITAVYDTMLPRQPLRFLLADDPGAGKTIMAGLLIKELLIRGDLQRCLICCPGNLVEQWQDELWRKFQLDFTIVTRDLLENARSGNPYLEHDLVISRLDHMARNDAILARLEQTDWDLVVIDEAHKMSASFFGGEVRETKRYKLGKLLGSPARTRHLLLLTATPHSGKEEEFQLFLALLDADRFEGRFRDGVHQVDTSDLMRRLTKEQLLKFDGTPLFPERRAYTVAYKLSDAEAQLYRAVTEYVRQEMNRVERLKGEGEGRHGAVVGFALTVLQRRLASSPAAIYHSLRRRRERLESRLREERLLRRGARVDALAELPALSEEELDELDDAPDAEVEQTEEAVVDQASAARTIAELEAEIATLRRLETLALAVWRSGTDRKWEQLSDLLQHTPEMFQASGGRHKLIVFTEHRDTLDYLAERIATLLGQPEAVVTIHGGMLREERRAAQERFTQDKAVLVLVATDAAGEGINLQRAHLLVNYDLPWNPNRIEQRFGRIHRIGQTEVCHMWNLVAAETREGDVYLRLLRKLEQESAALGGQVFDVLGRLFEERRLRDLMIEAIRYGDLPEVRQRLYQAVDNAADRARIQALLAERALTHETLDPAQVFRIREEMERAEARRLQPHFIASFFLEAFRSLGGTVREREPRRYEITHVPAVLRPRSTHSRHAGEGPGAGSGDPVLARYERVTFHKELISVPGQPLAEFLCPGHSLLDATIDLVLERHRDLLQRGAVLVDPTDASEAVRALFYLEHAIQDGRTDRHGNRRIVSRQLQFVEIDAAGQVRAAGYAPYLDYRPATEAERALVAPQLEAEWLTQELDSQALEYAIAHLVPPHLAEVRARKEVLVTKTMAAVKDRLTKEIAYWDHRAQELKAQEEAGRTPRLNSARARQRADELEGRLRQRLAELDQARQLAALPPVAIGGALVVPAGLLARLGAAPLPVSSPPLVEGGETARVEALAVAAVLAHERALGHEPRDVSAEKRGYDIESRAPDGRLRFIEVKGRTAGARTVTVTKNEILTALNKPDDFWLALVEVDGDAARPPVYLRRPFRHEPDFAACSVTYDLAKLLAQAEGAE